MLPNNPAPALGCALVFDVPNPPKRPPPVEGCVVVDAPSAPKSPPEGCDVVVVPNKPPEGAGVVAAGLLKLKGDAVVAPVAVLVFPKRDGAEVAGVEPNMLGCDEA